MNKRTQKVKEEINKQREVVKHKPRNFWRSCVSLLVIKI